MNPEQMATNQAPVPAQRRSSVMGGPSLKGCSLCVRKLAGSRPSLRSWLQRRGLSSIVDLAGIPAVPPTDSQRSRGSAMWFQRRRRGPTAPPATLPGVVPQVVVGAAQDEVRNAQDSGDHEEDVASDCEDAHPPRHIGSRRTGSVSVSPGTIGRSMRHRHPSALRWPDGPSPPAVAAPPHPCRGSGLRRRRLDD
jgi:hypothetical protein